MAGTVEMSQGVDTTQGNSNWDLLESLSMNVLFNYELYITDQCTARGLDVFNNFALSRIYISFSQNLLDYERKIYRKILILY